MALGIIIHISVGSEKRTEYFSDERLSIGSDETCDLQIHTKQLEPSAVWLKLENTESVYRVVDFDSSLGMNLNGKPLRRFIAIADGDLLTIPDTEISFAFYALAEKPSLITTKRPETQVAPFIAEAALDAASSPERDDAKAFLREFTRELMREIRWTTKAIILVLVVGFLSGILYLGYAVNSELRASREQAERQREIIDRLNLKVGQASNQLGDLQVTNEALIRERSLAQNVRVDYGQSVCLIVGVYQLIDRQTGRVLRYQDPNSTQVIPVEPAVSEDERVPMSQASGLTVEGNGSPVEYDFIGTGFHVGGGYIVTNRHVLQPWTEDDLIKTMMRDYKGRARVKSLVVYFPNLAEPFRLTPRQTGKTEDVAVATIDSTKMPADLPAVPLEAESQAATIGRLVVTMGYPNGPDRLLAMVEDEEAKSINSRFGGSRQNLINFLAQSKKIVPLTTQGAITDLDTKRIVHDAKTAEGGSGAPLFGQSGKVIGVNFGVFTENTAVNMAVPIRFAIDLLRLAGWKTPEEMQLESTQASTPNSNSATNTATALTNPR